MTGATLREFADRGRTDAVASVSLFGGAIPNEQCRGRRAIRVGYCGDRRSCFNFYSRNDRILGGVYRASDRTRAVGHGGLEASASAPASYTDVDVIDLVADHYSDAEPKEGCLPRVVGQIRVE